MTVVNKNEIKAHKQAWDGNMNYHINRWSTENHMNMVHFTHLDWLQSLKQFSINVSYHV